MVADVMNFRETLYEYLMSISIVIKLHLKVCAFLHNFHHYPIPHTSGNEILERKKMFWDK